MTEKQTQIAAELQRLLEAGGYRVGALFVTCEPLPGPELETRVIYAIAAHGLTEATAPDLVNLCKTLRRAADELEGKWRRAGEAST